MSAQGDAWGPEHNNGGALKGRNSEGLDMPRPCR